MPNQTDNKRETVEVNTENVKLQTVKTFRMRVEEMEGTPFLICEFGNFLDENVVEVAAKIALPADKAIHFANCVVSASAYYQVMTGKDIGVSEKICEEMKQLIKEAGV